jgi:hypothetical protein
MCGIWNSLVFGLRLLRDYRHKPCRSPQRNWELKNESLITIRTQISGSAYMPYSNTFHECLLMIKMIIFVAQACAVSLARSRLSLRGVLPEMASVDFKKHARRLVFRSKECYIFIFLTALKVNISNKYTHKIDYKQNCWSYTFLEARGNNVTAVNCTVSNVVLPFFT